MGESAWATARTRSRPSARFHRLARRFGRGHEKNAAVAVADTLACIVWAVMKYDQDYAEAGEDYYDPRDHENLIPSHPQALARPGYPAPLAPPRPARPP